MISKFWIIEQDGAFKWETLQDEISQKIADIEYVKPGLYFIHLANGMAPETTAIHLSNQVFFKDSNLVLSQVDAVLVDETRIKVQTRKVSFENSGEVHVDGDDNIFSSHGPQVLSIEVLG